jgi:hypothetical protein
VATWNLSNRRATGSAPDDLLINGQPLVFYHFSGFDSGAQETMLGVYGKESPQLTVLRRWYIAECESEGQSTLGKLPCIYGRYDNGESIQKVHRLLYRDRQDVQRAFPDPFSTKDINRSYLDWYKANVQSEPQGLQSHSVVNNRLSELQRELDAIKRSRSWQWAQRFSSWARVLR